MGKISLKININITSLRCSKNLTLHHYLHKCFYRKSRPVYRDELMLIKKFLDIKHVFFLIAKSIFCFVFIDL